VVLLCVINRPTTNRPTDPPTGEQPCERMNRAPPPNTNRKARLLASFPVVLLCRALVALCNLTICKPQEQILLRVLAYTKKGPSPIPKKELPF
jgi:hypothetical protein